MRLFVAAEPSAPVRRAAAGIAATVRERLVTVREFRWVPAENLHLTLWFLGEVAESRCPAILEALSEPFADDAFRLHLSGLGTFPPTGSPRVLWLGVTEGRDPLARLHRLVGERLAPLGFTAETRPYSAHLTLARIKEPLRARARSKLRELLPRVDADAGRCLVEELTVFRSRTSPRGAVYEPLVRVPLK